MLTKIKLQKNEIVNLGLAIFELQNTKTAFTESVNLKFNHAIKRTFTLLKPIINIYMDEENELLKNYREAINKINSEFTESQRGSTEYNNRINSVNIAYKNDLQKYINYMNEIDEIEIYTIPIADVPIFKPEYNYILLAIDPMIDYGDIR